MAIRTKGREREENGRGNLTEEGETQLGGWPCGGGGLLASQERGEGEGGEGDGEDEGNKENREVEEKWGGKGRRGDEDQWRERSYKG